MTNAMTRSFQYLANTVKRQNFIRGDKNMNSVNNISAMREGWYSETGSAVPRMKSDKSVIEKKHPKLRQQGGIWDVVNQRSENNKIGIMGHVLQRRGISTSLPMKSFRLTQAYPERVSSLFLQKDIESIANNEQQANIEKETFSTVDAIKYNFNVENLNKVIGGANPFKNVDAAPHGVKETRFRFGKLLSAGSRRASAPAVSSTNSGSNNLLVLRPTSSANYIAFKLRQSQAKRRSSVSGTYHIYQSNDRYVKNPRSFIQQRSFITSSRRDAQIVSTMDFNGSVDPIVQTVNVDGTGIKTESIHLSEIVSEAIMKFINYEFYSEDIEGLELDKVVQTDKTLQIEVMNSEQDDDINKKNTKMKLDGDLDDNLVQKRFRSFK